MKVRDDRLAASQVARRLGVSTARVAQLRVEGKLTGMRTALGYLYTEEAVARLERERAKKSSGRQGDDQGASQAWER